MLNFATADTATGGGILGLIWPFLLMFAVFYFLLIRPQQKKNKARTQMLNAIQKGERVTTIGGLHGTIVEITDDIVVLQVNDATKMTFDRSAVSSRKESATTPETKE